jgi:exodeoxyribonuclease III
MAFRKKAAHILAYRPDVLVVPECEHPDKLLYAEDLPKPTSTLWFGHNANKGLAVFSYGGFSLRKLKVHNEDFKLVVPIAVTGGGFDFTLFAIWANHPADPDGAYVTQIWKAMQHYRRLIKKKRTVLMGDFNSNSIFDRPRREGNHSTLVKLLETKGIESVYHKHYNQHQGKELHPTWYLYRHENKPFHLDYCFASADMLSHLQSVEVGDYASWRPYSDHVPLMVRFAETLYTNVE